MMEHKSFAKVWKERSEEHTSELQSLTNLVCRLLLEKKNATTANRCAIRRSVCSLSAALLPDERRERQNEVKMIGPPQSLLLDHALKLCQLRPSRNA